MESFIALFIGIFGGLVGTFKIVRGLRRNDTTKQEIALWILIFLAAVAVTVLGANIGFIQPH